MKVPIGNITIGKDRIRKEMGDLDKLAASIKERGRLLHPIGVIDLGHFEYKLIYGERRLRACKMLGWKEIEVSFGPEEDSRHSEIDENECRLELSNKEKLELVKYLRSENKGNQGKRTDLTSVTTVPEVENTAENGSENEEEPKKERDAKKAGFKNYKEMQRHAKVLEECAEDVIEEFNSNNLTLNDCLSICDLDKKTQSKILKKKFTEGYDLLKTARTAWEKETSAPEQADPVFDKFGVQIPDNLLYLLEENSQWEAARAEVRAARITVNKLDKTLIMLQRHGNNQLKENFTRVETFLAQNQFSFVCPHCEGVKQKPTCECCDGKLWFAVCDEDKVDRKRFKKKAS